MSGLGCDRTHGRSGSAQIETNKFQSTLPEGSDRRHQQICGASLRRRVERPHHDTSQVVHLLKIPDFLFVWANVRRPARDCLFILREADTFVRFSVRIIVMCCCGVLSTVLPMIQIPRLDSLVLLSLERFSTVVGCWSVPNVTIISKSVVR